MPINTLYKAAGRPRWKVTTMDLGTRRNFTFEIFVTFAWCMLFLMFGCVHRSFEQSRFRKMVTIVNENLQIPTGEIRENRLLDVAITLTDPAREQGVVELNSAIRNAERHFMAQHLKKTLERSHNWGSVRVVPEPIEHADLLIKVTLNKSEGARFIAEVEARDATGKVWLKESFWQGASNLDFQTVAEGERDVSQGFYNHIVNRLGDVRLGMNDDELVRIHEIATLRFAAQLSPEPFSDYYTKNDEGMITLLRLPARDAPEMERVLQVRKRDEMFGEVLNEYYEDFYTKIWPSYESWRHEIWVERMAENSVRREGRKKAILGTVLLGAAAAVGASGIDSSEAAAAMMAGAGVVQVASGISRLSQIKEHKKAIAELTESFAAESKPIVMEFEGKQFELQGTATEQFHKWQTLLRQLYRDSVDVEPLE